MWSDQSGDRLGIRGQEQRRRKSCSDREGRDLSGTDHLTNFYCHSNCCSCLLVLLAATTNSSVHLCPQIKPSKERHTHSSNCFITVLSPSWMNERGLNILLVWIFVCACVGAGWLVEESCENLGPPLRHGQSSSWQPPKELRSVTHTNLDLHASMSLRFKKKKSLSCQLSTHINLRASCTYGTGYIHT